MAKYFQITYSEDNGDYGVVQSPIDTDAFILPENGVEVFNWKELELELTEGGLTDYLSNDLGGRLCSPKLKEIFENYGSSDIQWLEVYVLNGGVKYEYYFLHFTKCADVLDTSKSIMVDDFVVKPVFSEELIDGRGLFPLPNSSDRSLFVSSEIKNKLETEKVTGIKYSSVKLV